MTTSATIDTEATITTDRAEALEAMANQFDSDRAELLRVVEQTEGMDRDQWDRGYMAGLEAAARQCRKVAVDLRR